MTFKEIYENNPELFDTGLLRMQAENKKELLRHLCLHSVSNKDIIGTISGIAKRNLISRIVDNVLALLEHSEYQYDKQLDIIKSLEIEAFTEAQGYSTNSLNEENTEGYDALPNILGQSFSRQKYTDYGKYMTVATIIEKDLEPVYAYLRKCIIPKSLGNNKDLSYYEILNPLEDVYLDRPYLYEYELEFDTDAAEIEVVWYLDNKEISKGNLVSISALDLPFGIHELKASIHFVFYKNEITVIEECIIDVGEPYTIYTVEGKNIKVKMYQNDISLIEVYGPDILYKESHLLFDEDGKPAKLLLRDEYYYSDKGLYLRIVTTDYTRITANSGAGVEIGDGPEVYKR